MLGGIGAALTVGVRRGSVLLSLLVLPLAMPLLIFGARAVELSLAGVPSSGPLQLLAAMFFLAWSLGPLAMAAAMACEHRRLISGVTYVHDVDLVTQARLAAARLPDPRAAGAVARLGGARPDRVAGAWWGLVRAPADYQQGEGFRILYVHAPAAWMSMFVYVVMAVAAAIGLIWRIKLAHAAAAACAPVGASFTFLALATGSIWGKPMWGTWWVWDARLTSELILLFLYLGYMALRSSFDDRAARRPGKRRARHRRRDQRADHPLLGRMVDDAAPAGERDAPREARRLRCQCWCRCS